MFSARACSCSPDLLGNLLQSALEETHHPLDHGLFLQELLVHHVMNQVYLHPLLPEERSQISVFSEWATIFDCEQ